MTLPEFELGMKKLIANYGSKTFSPEKILLFFDYVRHANEYIWSRTIDKVLLQYDKPPTLSQVTGILDNVSKSVLGANPAEVEASEPWPETHPDSKWFFLTIDEILKRKMLDQDVQSFKEYIGKTFGKRKA